jgi:hypothetical protein
MATPAFELTLMLSDSVTTCPMEFQAFVTTWCDPGASER